MKKEKKKGAFCFMGNKSVGWKRGKRKKRFSPFLGSRETEKIINDFEKKETKSGRGDFSFFPSSPRRIDRNRCDNSGNYFDLSQGVFFRRKKPLFSGQFSSSLFI